MCYFWLKMFCRVVGLIIVGLFIVMGPMSRYSIIWFSLFRSFTFLSKKFCNSLIHMYFLVWSDSMYVECLYCIDLIFFSALMVWVDVKGRENFFPHYPFHGCHWLIFFYVNLVFSSFTLWPFNINGCGCEGRSLWLQNWSERMADLNGLFWN